MCMSYSTHPLGITALSLVAKCFWANASWPKPLSDVFDKMYMYVYNYNMESCNKCNEKTHHLHHIDKQWCKSLLSMCDDKQTIETWNLPKSTNIYRGLLKFMANIAVLLKKSLGSVWGTLQSASCYLISSTLVCAKAIIQIQNEWFWILYTWKICKD